MVAIFQGIIKFPHFLRSSLPFTIYYVLRFVVGRRKSGIEKVALV